jgi:hypothetical protein
MITTQHAIRIAKDSYTLSSLFIRRVLLTSPVTLDAYREKTRELLLSQSRLSPASAAPTINGSNLAALALLKWDKEWNLVRYHGFVEYGKRWWRSRSKQQPRSITNTNNPDKKKSAQIAFMITSEQRRVLGELGYGADDIRSFKPIEALLLVKNAVKKENGSPNYNYAAKLKELVDENDKLMEVEQQAKREQSSKDKKQYSLSPEEVQNAHVKPDVALALLNAKNCDEEIIPEPTSIDEKIKDDTDEKSFTESETVDISDVSVPLEKEFIPTKSNAPIIRPIDSEELHMKPDVAAAYLSSQLQNQSERQIEVNFDEDDETTESCWYEVVEVYKNTDSEQIIALFSTKKEAIECARIKESFRARGSEGKEVKSGFIVRRRWNEL